MVQKKLLICGSGNSISEGIELGLLDIIPKNYSIGLNYWYKFGCETTFTTFVDYKFYRDNLDEIKRLPLLVGKNDVLLDKCRMKDGIIYNIKQDNTIFLPKSSIYCGTESWDIQKRFCLNCEHEYTEKNVWVANKEVCPKCRFQNIRVYGFYSSHLVGCFALTLGIALGFKEIYLLGYDCCKINGKTHFYQDNISLDKKNMDNDTFYGGVGTKIDKFGREIYNTGTYTYNAVNEKWFKPYLEEKNVKIYNVSPESKLDIFDKIDYKEFFEKIKNNEVNQNKERENIKNFILDKLECNS